MVINAHSADGCIAVEVVVADDVGRLVGVELGLEDEGILKHGYVKICSMHTGTAVKHLVIDTWDK